MTLVSLPAGGRTDGFVDAGVERADAGVAGTALIIENVTGATGSLGVVQSAPDGYTVSIGNTSTHVINGAVFNLKYDVLKDLDPVALLPSSAFLLVARTSIPAKSPAGPRRLGQGAPEAVVGRNPGGRVDPANGGHPAGESHGCAPAIRALSRRRAGSASASCRVRVSARRFSSALSTPA